MLNKRATMVANGIKRKKWNKWLEEDFQQVLMYFEKHGEKSIEWTMMRNGNVSPSELPEMRCWLRIVLR